eukprot:3911106-Prymnesium_polylepis.2
MDRDVDALAVAHERARDAHARPPLLGEALAEILAEHRRRSVEVKGRRATDASAADQVHPTPIVRSALAVVREHLVRGTDFDEHVLRLLSPLWILVGVPPQRQQA